MPYQGFVIHHSRCRSINGKGFDFWVGEGGDIYAAPLLTDPDYIHICLEGDFHTAGLRAAEERQVQLFAAGRLILGLAEEYGISPVVALQHCDSCPGLYFPWNALVIYPADGYH